ncbi:hypothetical protein OG301_23165 [Streptomyces platensis]|uniref:hypothetical protein n=1 Tax=Streptomyces platensis TaxID=58346 RepID=UPI002ED182EA|nr:hypothetical protein OG301_23165 [Streptomyces platensis]
MRRLQEDDSQGGNPNGGCAGGFSCRTQLDQLSDRRGRHLAEVLAEGLGEAGE